MKWLFTFGKKVLVGFAFSLLSVIKIFKRYSLKTEQASCYLYIEACHEYRTRYKNEDFAY